MSGRVGVGWIPYGALAILPYLLGAPGGLAVQFHQCRSQSRAGSGTLPDLHDAVGNVGREIAFVHLNHQYALSRVGRIDDEARVEAWGRGNVVAAQLA